MTYRNLILLLFMGFFLKVPAQFYQWANRVGNAQNGESLSGLVTDGMGNSISVGTFQGTVDFNPGSGVFNLTSTGSSDQTYILKLDAAGNFVWAKGITCTDYVRPYSVARDPDGNIFVGGTFLGTADFDPGSVNFPVQSFPTNKTFVLKLDPNGNFLWVRPIGASWDGNTAYALTVDGAGNVYHTGRQSGNTDYDLGPAMNYLYGANNVFILKMNSAGNFVWVKGLGTTGTKDIWGIKADANGNFCVTGSYTASFDTDPGPGTNMITASSALTDAFIIKFDASGNHLWGKGIGAAGGNDAGLAVALDPSGSVLVTGYFRSNAMDFDPGAGTSYSSTAGLDDIFVLKLNSAGDYVWHTVTGGGSADRGNAIDTDPLGNVFTTGQFGTTVDFDPGPSVEALTSAGLRDGFVQVLNPNGIHKDSYRWGGNADDWGAGIAVPNYNSIYTGGVFKGTVDFDPGAGIANLASAGNYDVFVSKIDQCIPTTSTLNPIVCHTYTAPDGQDYTASGTYTAIIPNNQTCDSIITINLTINLPPSQPGTISGNTIICAGSTNSYSVTAVPGATDYTWSLPSGWSGTSNTNSIVATASSVGGTISVTAYNACGGSATRTLNVAINAIPAQPGSITGNTGICPGSSNTYSIPSVPGASGYTWTLPGGWTGSSSTTSITTTANSTGGNIAVVADNPCGSSPAQSLPISIVAVPAQPGSISGNISVCTGSVNTYSIVPVPGATSYIWSLPGGWSGSSTTNSVTSTAGPSGGTISVTAYNASCPSIVQSQTVNMYPNPVAAFTASANGQLASFTDLSSGATSWAWDFGDWSTSTAQNPTHTYVLPFVYNVCLTATAANGCSESVCQYVPVNAVLGAPDSTGLNVSVYPNPSSGWFRIVTDRKLEGHVFDAQGKLVMMLNYPPGDSWLDLSGYAEGIYFLRLTKGSAVANFRLSKVGE